MGGPVAHGYAGSQAIVVPTNTCRVSWKIYTCPFARTIPLKANRQAGCGDFSQKMYRHSPDVSTVFCRLHCVGHFLIPKEDNLWVIGIECLVVTSAQSLLLTASIETTLRGRGGESEKPAHPERKNLAPFKRHQIGQRVTEESPLRDPQTEMDLSRYEKLDL